MAVTRRWFVGSVITAAASYLTGLERVAAARKRRHTFANAGLAKGVGTVGITVVRTHYLEDPGQEAVALTPADGEFLTGNVQSNFDGNGYYERNGFTRAAAVAVHNEVGNDFVGFDDINFIPIGIWLVVFNQTAADYDLLDDTAINGLFPCFGGTDRDMALARGKWCTVDGSVGEVPIGSIPADEDPIVVGYIVGEEPTTIAGFDAITDRLALWDASADGPGRFRQTNFFHNLLNGDIESTYFPDDMVQQGDFTQCDAYWYTGSPVPGFVNGHLVNLLYQSTPGGDATDAQCGRGCHYGSMMDSIRKQYPGAGQVDPFAVWVETCAPWSEAASKAMTPTMLGWAVWSTFVHGARSIQYFPHNFRAGDSFGNVPFDDHFGGPGIEGTGIYAALKQINERAIALAPVINSPWDGYFVYGDTSTGGSIALSGFLTAVTSTNSRSKYAGVDASCRWQPTEQKHYIFSTTREPEASTNIPVTFRMVDQGQTTATEVHGGGTITIERGGGIPGGFCEFDDTFATASTYKVYRID